MSAPMPTGGPMRSEPTGALWCEVHDRWECTRKSRRTQSRCHGRRIEGRDACRMHVGESIDVARAKGQAALEARAWLPDLDGEQVDPSRAVLGMLSVSWARATFYADLLREQVDAQGAATDVDDGEDGDGDERAGGGDGSGLVGHTYASNGEGGTFASAEALRALVLLDAQERDRVVRFAKAAHDMGIAEREIRLAESQGQMLAAGLGWLLAELGLEADERARSLVASMLRALGDGQVPGRAIEGETA